MMLNGKVNVCIFVIFITIFKFEGVWTQNIQDLEDGKTDKCENFTNALNKVAEEMRKLQRQIVLQKEDSIAIRDGIRLIKNSFHRPNIFESCEAAMRTTHIDNGIFNLYLTGSELALFEANCKIIDGIIWTIIQRRQDGTVDFARNWTDYKNGFGKLDGEFWLGLDRIHELTKHGRHELKIWMKNEYGTERFVRYKNFKIGDEAEKYKMNVGDYTGIITDVMRWSNNRFFATPDRNNNEYANRACPGDVKSGWWFHSEDCYWTLNGPYNADDKHEFGIYWWDFGKKLKYTQMAIRPLN